MRYFKTINPSTEEVIKDYTVFNEAQVLAGIKMAYRSFLYWKKTTFLQRSETMLNMANLLKKNKRDLALLMAREMGKPITLGRNEIEKCAWVCEHYAHHAESYLQLRLIKTEMEKTMVCYQPLGVIFAIMPWNYPFWQVFRFAVPAIMAGNAVILKHAPIVIGCGEKITQLFLDAGFPEHLFQHFILDNQLAADVIANEKIMAVTFTGSASAGAEVAAHAAAHLKKTVLELGGNDPYVVLHDANLNQAAKAIVSSRLNNAGQVCIAAKRVISVESVYKQLVEKISHLMLQYTLGDPFDENTTMGPLARDDLRTHLHDQVERSIALGAKLLVGGKIPSRTGFYYFPTLMGEVTPTMPAFEEELFGPVIAMIRARDESHAIQLANQSSYGLGAAIFTQDKAHGEYLAQHEIEAGSCFVNAFVSSDPRVPFGGIKHSGYGRELSKEGILEFVNTKTVSVNA